MAEEMVHLGGAGDIVVLGYRLPAPLCDAAPDDEVALPLSVPAALCEHALAAWAAPAALARNILEDPRAIEDILRCEMLLRVLMQPINVAHRWLGRQNAAAPFNGLSPLEHMMEFGTAPTRRYLHSQLR